MSGWVAASSLIIVWGLTVVVPAVGPILPYVGCSDPDFAEHVRREEEISSG
ncbi:hypothetical protein ACFVZJ_39835 [Streptomyces sp. NPDC058322]|uniref:hypothetical protein n=1 Tax=unclassified Streptomyces TaxID=2593676 RepID=UPI0036F13651